MRDGSTGFMHALPFDFFQMYAMTEYRAFTDKAVVIINVEIAGALWKKFVYPGDFVGIFRNVRLHVRVGKLAPQRARRFQLRG